MSTRPRFELHPDRHRALGRIAAALRTRIGFSGNIVQRGVETFGEPWADAFERLVSALFPTEEAITAAVAGYSAFAMESMRLQAAFEREGRYKAKTHEQASEEVYLNERHMSEEYLPGLLLSHYLWPHHYRQLRFFETAFVEGMRVAGATSFVEVGVGTGLYSGAILRSLPEAQGLGIDISPWSKAFCERQLSAQALADRYEVQIRDVTATPLEPKAEWLVCVEVLEHLDDPVAFLRALRANLAQGGSAFITAAVNAAHADHIYLYRDAGEVLAHLRQAGFSLEQGFVGAAYKPRAPGMPVPEVVAFVVS